MEREDVQYTLLFTQEEYVAMIKGILNRDYDLYIEIVKRILKNRFYQWRSNRFLQEHMLTEDIISFVLMELIKSARHIIRNGQALTPQHFQAWVRKVGKGRATDFINDECQARGDISGKKYKKLREELGLDEESEEINGETATKKRSYVTIVSLEAGGYNEDGDAQPLEIPSRDREIEKIERLDAAGKELERINDIVVSSPWELHKVITWFLYMTSLYYNDEVGAATKAYMEQRFSDKTLEELVEYLAAHRAITEHVFVTDSQIACLRERLMETDKHGECMATVVYKSFCMKGKTMRATISDWINRWNSHLIKKGVEMVWADI